MKRLLLDFLWAHLHALGATRDRPPAGLLPLYDAWFAECARILAAEGYTDQEPRSLSQLWAEWAEQRPRWRENPDLAATHLLVEATLEALPEILTGRRLATEVMFPGSSMELVENAYTSNPAAAFFNRVLATTLVTHLRDRGPARILEIGAGTGATSAVALAALRDAGVTVAEYRYTDLSRAFLAHAERSYGPEYPFLTYGVLDVEQPVAERDYDVVVAANVLHATRDIRATLRNTKAALAPGGLLLLNELTVNNLVNQFTFGLLEGWWRYTDPETRIPGSPILSVEGWQRVLTETGFGPVTWPVADAADLGQQIVVAQSDGAVRRAAAAAPEPAVVRSEQATAAGAAAHVEATLLDVLAESLRIDRARIARDEPFSNYGLDSIFAVNVAREVGERLGIDLDITILFEHTTVAAFVEFACAEYATELPSPRPPAAISVEPDAMAIVGMSVRFPGADDLAEFERIVEHGTRCITPPPTARADWTRHDPAGIWGGFLDGVHEFDPLFFAMSMTEARQVTPEFRLMVMTAWNAVEDAGYRPAELRTRPTGVFVAAGPSEYTAPDGAGLAGLPSPAMIPNRVSYLLDLHGPSEQVDTTCSSSLVALHRAIRAIRDGECEQALVGGVNLVMSPAGSAGMRAAGMLSPSGHVRPFQQEADGTVRSEGVAAVLVKPLARALEDGDHVHGVVRGTGVAHGGRGVSFTAPNIRGMKSAIAHAYADAGVDPGTVSYVETHGMSALLADSAEIAALGAGLGTGEPAYLGSLKPCLGHTEVVSGLAALVKTVQALRRDRIPAIPGFGRLHESISLAGTRLRIATEPVPWPARTDAAGRVLPRRAAVNSFGIGGVNAHVVLEQPLSGPESERAAEPQLIVLSARTAAALRERARRLVGWVRGGGAASWADVAYTLQVGREAMDHRLALVAGSADEAAAALAGWLDGDPAAPVVVADAARRAGAGLDALAEVWVRGGPVDWSLLHDGATRRRVPLPGYPFEQRTCLAAPPQAAAPAPDHAAAVTGLVASVLGLEPEEIDGGKSLADYGLNSLLQTAVLSGLRGAYPAFRPEWLQVHDTLDELVGRLAGLERAGGRGYPELVALNGVERGRPVFWIHGALASVEAYRGIAARVDRPFYGIQARGFLTDDAPVDGIPAMAEYYAEIIGSVQPDGPYDVGGFCLGGVVAYEITRLLQERGQEVRSLIMVDSPDNSGLARSNHGGASAVRSAALQVVNSLLWPAGEQDLDRVRPRLIHQDEVDTTLDDAAFVERLAGLAVERGLAMAPAQIVAFTRRNIGVQLAYRLGEFAIRPLTGEVDGTYVRNRRGHFMGELEPYFQVAGETFSLDHITYWQDWQRELPGLRMVDIDAANHMTILNDAGPLAVIEQACLQTYAGSR